MSEMWFHWLPVPLAELEFERILGHWRGGNDIPSNTRICRKIAVAWKAGSSNRIRVTFANRIYRRIEVVRAAANSNRLLSISPICIWWKIRDVPATANSSPDHPAHPIFPFLRPFHHP